MPQACFRQHFQIVETARGIQHLELPLSGSRDRDRGLLEAALFRPQTGYYADLLEEAAALWESLSQNHPFIDGNKRTAFAVTYTFLAINGAQLTTGLEETLNFVSGLYEAETFDFDRLNEWLHTSVIISTT